LRIGRSKAARPIRRRAGERVGMVKRWAEMQRVLILVLSLIGWAVPVAAQEFPKGIEQALDRQKKFCLDNGGTAVTFARNAVRKIDLNGDGRDDYILDMRDTVCEEMRHAYCGTGGCEVEILIAQRDGSYTSIFSDTIRGYQIKPGRGVRTVRFSLHGGYCGKSGPSDCHKTRRIDGKPFKFKD
jgi:hypothetical protein